MAYSFTRKSDGRAFEASAMHRIARRDGSEAVVALLADGGTISEAATDWLSFFSAIFRDGALLQLCELPVLIERLGDAPSFQGKHARGDDLCRPMFEPTKLRYSGRALSRRRV
jgi:hypothetical protein